MSADLEQQIAQAERAQGFDAVVDSEALGDARQVEHYAAGLQHARVGWVEGQPVPADARARMGQRR